ncbi:MAG TPA: sigma-70 family RNA polymerase sigma factor [Ideonella sp.]|uniref:RNA polymerase sigma factor n=1 Tax=Ideonella sp. TaxID=1929293 RepID=UPI002E30E189|nr:sigma-70 family RNA polymerase sigma factor [Ideonella sp.]HEX5688124.1 sigma-70 family RNA polymerase sigma factor [Ideonella sp.]
MADASDDHADDATLARRCRDGDAGAWPLLVARYQRLVYAIVTRMGLDEHVAADVFQAVFEKLVRHLPSLREPERLQAWIVTTAKREGLAARRHGQRQVSMTRADEGDDSQGTEEWDIADDNPGAEQQLDELQQLHRLRLGLDRLDERCRELLLLVFRDDDDRLGYDEVSRRLNLPVGSIGPTRSRCLGKLRKLLP